MSTKSTKIDRRRQNPGGARQGSGGTVRHIVISLERARTLRALLRAQIGGTYSAEAAAAWVESKINESWAAYDAQIQADKEQGDERAN